MSSDTWPLVGEFPMKVVEWKLEETEEKKAPYIFVLCEVTGGEYDGEQAGMKVFLLKKDGAPNEFARETLRVMGWTGKDFINMPGLGSTIFPGMMATRSYTDKYGQVKEVTELSGIKGVSAQKRGNAVAPQAAKNLAKLFGASTSTESDDSPI